MKQDTKEAEKLKELLKKADGHPMMIAILAEEAAAILAKRTEAAGKIEALRKEQEQVIPKLQEAVKDKEAAYKTAKAGLDADLGELKKVKAALSSENHNFDTEIRNLERVLYETADLRIDEGIEFFRGKINWLRQPGRIDRTAGKAENNVITWTKKVSEETNVAAIRSALQYCMEAIKALENLKLTPALGVERIEALKSGVPKIDEYEEITGIKPMERQGPPSIWRSDYQDEQVERLLRKKI